jgi:hypothetical protein
MVLFVLRPFLSFDIITESKELHKMNKYPYDVYFVSGT